MDESPSSREPAWHALLAPLPDGAVPRRRPVVPPEVMLRNESAAVAGWEQLVLEMPASEGGLRVTLAVLDGSGRAISGSDAVLRRRTLNGEAGVEFTHETLGGRFESDTVFLGTRWKLVTVEHADGRAERLEATPSAPTAEEEAGLRALVAELMRRAPPAAGTAPR